LFPNVREALAILKPDTVIRWHRAGFRAYWRWKSGPRGGRPKVSPEMRGLIRDMSLANPLEWHGQRCPKTGGRKKGYLTPRRHGGSMIAGIRIDEMLN
jgi:hypothetical protein